MKFNIIVGNPPYNEGLYINFQSLINKLEPCFASYITPVGFIRLNNNFNNHLRSIVHYKKCSDIFKNILIVSGVCYYLYDSTYDNRINGCNIKSVYNKKHTLSSSRLINNQLDNIVNTVLIKNKHKNKYNYDEFIRQYNVVITNFNSGGLLKGSVRTPVSFVYDKHNVKNISYGYIIQSSDNIDECINFGNWLNSKLMSYIVSFITVNDGFTHNYKKLLNNVYFDDSFVNKKLTDDEIFDAYEVSEDHRNFINGIVNKKRPMIFYNRYIEDDNARQYFDSINHF